MNELTMYLDGVLCGVVTQTGSGSLTFSYDADYVGRSGHTPLSLSMPSSTGRHPQRSILPYLAGLLPDSDQALAALGRRYGVSPRSPFALLAHVGEDVAGAVQVVPAGRPASDAAGDRGRVEMLSPAEVENMLAAVVEEYRDGRPHPELVQRFSLAGAQPKIALHRVQTGWARPLGATPTTHILKPTAGTFRRLDLVEHLTMRAAKHLDLAVADSELGQFGNVRAFVTKRYDRRLSAGRWVRLHQEDLCQSLAVSPEKKYQHRDGGPGVGAIAGLLRSLPVRSDRSRAAEQFFRALMFNTVLEGTDAHAKNYSVVLVGDRVALAPLYDLTTYAPYRSGQPTYSAMKIGDEYAFGRIGLPHCLAAARTLGVDANLAVDIITKIRVGAVGAFEQARDEIRDADQDTAEMAGSILDAVSRLPLVVA